MLRFNRMAILTASMLVASLCAGCGAGSGSNASAEIPPSNAGLLEVGEMYRAYLKQVGKPPAKMKDIELYSPGFPQGSLMLQNGELVTFWGVTALTESGAGHAVLAYESKAPTGGGVVLLDDGETIKQMTTEEFQAAPKAGTIASTPDKRKSVR